MILGWKSLGSGQQSVARAAASATLGSETWTGSPNTLKPEALNHKP